MSGSGRSRWRIILPIVLVGLAAQAVVILVLQRSYIGGNAPSTTAAPVEQQSVDPDPSEPADTTASTALEIVVVSEYDHDSTYTQGLEFIDDGPDAGLLLESGGQWGESLLRVWDPATGEVVRIHDLDDDLFAEGVTLVGDDVWQLTWQAETAFRYDLDTLTPVEQVGYDGEGWGLCQLGTDLVMSDGSSTLTFRHPDTFEAMAAVQVTRDGVPVQNLNELECVPGADGDLVWANVYQTTDLLAIDPGSGQVVHTVDASSLVPDDFVGNNDLVLNGIAYQPDTDRFWLTGKRWPVLYEVELR